MSGLCQWGGEGCPDDTDVVRKEVAKPKFASLRDVYNVLIQNHRRVTYDRFYVLTISLIGTSMLIIRRTLRQGYVSINQVHLNVYSQEVDGAYDIIYQRSDRALDRALISWLTVS